MGQHTDISFCIKRLQKAYQEAYKICEQPDMLKAYLYSCYRALPHEEYIKLLSGNPVLLSLDTVIQNEIDQTKKKDRSGYSGRKAGRMEKGIPQD